MPGPQRGAGQVQALGFQFLDVALQEARLALGRDGSLCLWGDPGAGLYLDRTGQDRQGLLLPSRIHASEIARLSP